MKSEPAYKRIKSDLKDRILAKQIETISESKIIRSYAVSATTSRRVLNELEEEGFLERRIGVGSIVRKELFGGMRYSGLSRPFFV